MKQISRLITSFFILVVLRVNVLHISQYCVLGRWDFFNANAYINGFLRNHQMLFHNGSHFPFSEMIYYEI